MRKSWSLLFALLGAGVAYASVFGVVRAIVHDPQHRPILNAEVILASRNSSWKSEAHADPSGLVQFTSVPIGEYELHVHAPGFADRSFPVLVISDRIQLIHAALSVAPTKESVEVSSPTEELNTSSTTQTSVAQKQIERTPGADRTNSLSFITDYVPGAFVVHDQLHVRGGHQVTWAIDGVPVPNTNIATNVGPQFDPKDVDFLEAQRGGLMAEAGDRTYAVFNVAPHSGFERQRQAELLLSYGNLITTDDQISFGDHTERFAYYVSANGNRTDYGLEPPMFANLHNQSAGGGAFTSLTYNTRGGDQWRFAGQARGDNFQVPNDPETQASGVRDRQREQDAFGTLTYLHPHNSSTVLTVSPFFHFNRAAFEGGPSDIPSAVDNRSSLYAGGQVALAYLKGKHNARLGVYAFGQHDNALFSMNASDGSGYSLRQRELLTGDLEALFLEDQFRPWQWITLNGGVRFTRFAGQLTETAASPRAGLALQIPPLKLVLRASYSWSYQAPPLSTISGPLLDFVLSEGFAFLPLRGERDEQYEVGVAIPLRGWTFDFDYFRNGATNYFDHDAIGNSNIFFPLTMDHVRIRGEEVTVRSPKILKRVSVHLAYSHQSVEGQGATTGGLTDFTPPESGFFYLDHDQRDTLSTGFDAELGWATWVSGNFSYGSGFLDGDGPGHLPSYNTVDVAIGKSLGENWSVKLTGTNLGDARYFIDKSNTFGGSHVSDPRRVSLQVRYRFHY